MENNPRRARPGACGLFSSGNTRIKEDISDGFASLEQGTMKPSLWPRFLETVDAALADNGSREQFLWAAGLVVRKIKTSRTLAETSFLLELMGLLLSDKELAHEILETHLAEIADIAMMESSNRAVQGQRVALLEAVVESDFARFTTECNVDAIIQHVVTMYQCYPTSKLLSLLEAILRKNDKSEKSALTKCIWRVVDFEKCLHKPEELIGIFRIAERLLDDPCAIGLIVTQTSQLNLRNVVKVLDPRTCAAFVNLLCAINRQQPISVDILAIFEAVTLFMCSDWDSGLTTAMTGLIQVCAAREQLDLDMLFLMTRQIREKYPSLLTSVTAVKTQALELICTIVNVLLMRNEFFSDLSVMNFTTETVFSISLLLLTVPFDEGRTYIDLLAQFVTIVHEKKLELQDCSQSDWQTFVANLAEWLEENDDAAAVEETVSPLIDSLFFFGDQADITSWTSVCFRLGVHSTTIVRSELSQFR